MKKKASASVIKRSKKSTKKTGPKKRVTKSARKKSVRKKSVSKEPIEQAFRYCPSCQTPNDDPGSIPFRCHQCGFAFFFGPVAAVGGLILNEDDQLLLVRRARDPGKGQWGLPGGFVDRGESIEDALHREVIEETQLKVVSQTLLTTGPNVYTYQGVTADVVDLFYLCRVASPDKVRLEPTELIEYKWCVPTKRDLNNMAFESNRIAIEVWLKSRQGKSK